MEDEPSPLDAAVECVMAHLSEEDAAFIRDAGPADMIRMHFGLGLWIRNNLGLWRGAALRDFPHGFRHEDDISSDIIRAVQARLKAQKPSAGLPDKDIGDAT